MKTSLLLITNRAGTDCKKLYELIDQLKLKLADLNYNVERVLFTSEDEENLAYDLHHCLLHSDFVIFIGGLSGAAFTGLMFKITAKLFHQELVYNAQVAQAVKAEAAIPMYAKVISPLGTCPALYVQGVLLATKSILSPSFNVLEPFLKRLATSTTYKRVLHFSMAVQSTTHTNRKPSYNNVAVEMVPMGNTIKFILTSASCDDLKKCENRLKDTYRENFVRSEEGTNIAELIYNQRDYPHIRDAIENITECFRKYGPEKVFFCFNGGKDCTVLLHLTLGVLKGNYPNHGSKLPCLYVIYEDPFPEVNKFVEQCEWYYDLNVLRQTQSLKEALTDVLRQNPHLQACLMGTRRTDPHSEDLDVFQMTDEDWPSVMRVSPLLDWNYAMIWDYLLDLKVPYCNIYDSGYTSLGNRSNTIPNPALRVYNVMEQCDVYMPAYKLLDNSLERDSRVS